MLMLVIFLAGFIPSYVLLSEEWTLKRQIGGAIAGILLGVCLIAEWGQKESSSSGFPPGFDMTLGWLMGLGIAGMGMAAGSIVAMFMERKNRPKQPEND